MRTFYFILSIWMKYKTCAGNYYFAKRCALKWRYNWVDSIFFFFVKILLIFIFWNYFECRHFYLSTTFVNFVYSSPPNLNAKKIIVLKINFSSFPHVCARKLKIHSWKSWGFLEATSTLFLFSLKNSTPRWRAIIRIYLHTALYSIMPHLRPCLREFFWIIQSAVNIRKRNEMFVDHKLWRCE